MIPTGHKRERKTLPFFVAFQNAKWRYVVCGHSVKSAGVMLSCCVSARRALISEVRLEISISLHDVLCKDMEGERSGEKTDYCRDKMCFRDFLYLCGN